MVHLAISDTNFQADMETEAADVIDFEDEYDKAEPIDDENLDESMNTLNESIREQEELEDRICRSE